MKDTQIQLDDFRQSKGLLAFTTYSLLACMLFVFYSPSALAFKQAMDHMPAPKSHADQLMIELAELKDTTNIALHLSNGEQNRTKALAIYQNKLAAQQAELTALAQHTKQDLQQSLELATEAQNLAQMQLYKQVLAAYDLHWPEIAGYLTAMTAKSQISRAEVEQFYSTLDTIKFGQSHHQYDNEQMPFGPLPNVAYKPSADLQALQARLGITEQPEIMSVARSADDLSQYLELNVDTASSDRLVQLATNLNGDAASIYQYVYNNIEYIPAFGSIQGADYTEQTQRGNAFDQASLMIALLRLSGIPARYVYGSVEVSPEQVKNWVGGVDVIEAAQNLLGQGGVPNVIINNQQGEVVSFGLEHVWVEYHQDGQWQAVDPSFKQYQFTKGVDVNQAVNFDGQSFVNALTHNASSDRNEGWVQGLDTQAATEQFDSVQSQLEAYITQQYPNATAKDLLGTKEIIAPTSSAVSFKKVRASQPLMHIPDNLRHKFGFELLSPAGSVASTVFKVEQPIPALAGKRLALSFVPATEQDNAKLASLLPENMQNINDLPSTMRYGAFNMQAHFSINEVTLKAAGNFPLGQELKTRKGFWTPRFGWDKGENPINVGEYRAIGIDTHGMSKSRYDELHSLAQQQRIQLEQNDLSGLSAHSTTGIALQAGITDYLSSTAGYAQLAAKVNDVVHFRQPSYGTFSTAVDISYVFGIPMRVSFGNVVMDVDRLSDNAESQSNCWNTWQEFNYQTGLVSSYLENAVPEQIFAGRTQSDGGMSATKAMAVAMQKGQKVYQLDSNNAQMLNAISIDIDARNEIRQALLQGKKVVVHERPVSIKGWTGSGYIIKSTDSGAGAYKISGGANGGVIGLTDSMNGILGLVDGLNNDLVKSPFSKIAKGIASWLGIIEDTLTILANCGGLKGFILGVMFAFAMAALLTQIMTFLLAGFTTLLLSFVAGVTIGHIVGYLFSKFISGPLRGLIIRTC